MVGVTAAAVVVAMAVVVVGVEGAWDKGSGGGFGTQVSGEVTERVSDDSCVVVSSWDGKVGLTSMDFSCREPAKK